MEKTFQCDKCEYATYWEHELNFHLAKHSCGLPFHPLTFTLATVCVILLWFSAVRPFQCPICAYSTIMKSSLVKHMRLHTGEQPYKCPMCEKSYTNQSALARHKRSHTGKFKRSGILFVSLLCGSCKATSGISSGEKPHRCDICGKQYADAKTMKTHRFQHKNAKPFSCEHCSFTCTKKDVLLSHLTRVHGETRSSNSLLSI